MTTTAAAVSVFHKATPADRPTDRLTAQVTSFLSEREGEVSPLSVAVSLISTLKKELRIIHLCKRCPLQSSQQARSTTDPGQAASLPSATHLSRNAPCLPNSRIMIALPHLTTSPRSEENRLGDTAAGGKAASLAARRPIMTETCQERLLSERTPKSQNRYVGRAAEAAATAASENH